MRLCMAGHITDDWDRRLCRTYLEEFMKPEQVNNNYYNASSSNEPNLLITILIIIILVCHQNVEVLLSSWSHSRSIV